MDADTPRRIEEARIRSREVDAKSPFYAISSRISSMQQWRITLTLAASRIQFVIL